MYSNNKWINTLSIMLALLSLSETLCSLALLTLISEVLYYTSSQLATASGLVAGLLSLPTAIKIRTFHSESKISIRHHDFHSYQKFLLYLCVGVQGIALLLVVIAIAQYNSIQKVMALSMVKYSKSHKNKIFVDTVQWGLQCCGVYSYRDWFSINWMGEPNNRDTREALKMLLKDEKDLSLNEKVHYLDTVPYSCCSKSNLNPCVHQNLQQEEYLSINNIGCAAKLADITMALLLMQLFLYVSLAIVMVSLIVLMKLDGDLDIFSHKESLSKKSRSSCPSHERRHSHTWSSFTNSFPAVGAAEINPSSHSELKLLLKQER